MNKAITPEYLPSVDESEIAGYQIMRSTADRNLFNVFSVDSKGELLACVEVDLSFEKASALVEVVNKEYYPYVPTPTEVAFVEVGGTTKVYNITSK